MTLTTEMILLGSFNLLLVIVFIIVAIKLILQSWKVHDNIFLLTGIAWFGISEPWWPSTVGFLMLLFTGKGISVELYIILNAVFLPIFLILWFKVMFDLMEIKKKNLLILIHILITVVLESLFFYFLFTNVAMLGTLVSPLDVEFGPFAQIFLVYVLTVFLISGYAFAIKTLRMAEPRPKLRGKFLLIAFSLYLIGAILEIIYTMVINRIIVLFSAIIFYVSFVMPEKIEKLFLK